MAIHIARKSTDVPYLQESIIEEFADLIIKSNDGNKVHINSLLLVSWNKVLKEPLKEAFMQNIDSVVISSNFCHSELIILRDFIMHNILPCSESDIISDKLSRDINNVFLSVGINLKVILNSFLIKKEDKNAIEDFRDSDPLPLEEETKDLITNLQPLCEITKIEKDQIKTYEKALKIEFGEHFLANDSKNGLLLQTTSDEKKVKGDKKVRCQRCKKYFVNLKCLLIHIRNIHDQNDKEFKCEKCNKGFYKASVLKSHIDRVHEGIKKYKCENCGRGFGVSSTLKAHIKSEICKKDLNVACELCDKKFRGNWQMKKHMKDDHTEYPCLSVNCGKVFEKIRELRNHQKGMN